VLNIAMNLFPRNVPITIRYAETLMKSGENRQAHLALLDLFNVVQPTPDQTRLIAKAAKDAGDNADSASYLAEFFLMTGNLDAAYSQLQMALSMPGLDPVQRARISARLEQVHEAMPKTHKVADQR
jgi:predicted Zn-dependent protease